MKQHAVLQDLQNQEILFDGDAEVTQTGKDGLIVDMPLGPDASIVYKILQNGILIQSRQGPDQMVQIVLKKSGTSKAAASHGLHTVELPIENPQIERKENTWIVRYKLSDSDENFAFELMLPKPLETPKDMR